jgi:hypothetical protein
MRLKSVTFGSAVKFRGSMENHVRCTEQNGIEIEFDKGMVIISTKMPKPDTVGVFTSNVKYFEPLEEPIAEDLKTYLIPSDELIQESEIAPIGGVAASDMLLRKKPGRKPKVNG